MPEFVWYEPISQEIIVSDAGPHQYLFRPFLIHETGRLEQIKHKKCFYVGVL